jgi:glycosyltransferase involved in cell wall biosynthesis
VTTTSPSGRRRRRALAAISPRLSGVTYVRFAQPFARLRDHGWELASWGESLRLTRGPTGFTPDTTILDGVDVLLFPQMVLAPVVEDGTRARVVEPLCDEANRRGIPVVYVVDDHLPGMDPTNPAYDAIHDSKDNLEALVSRCDAVIATTEPFRESLAAHGKPVHVVPNAVDPGHWPPRPRAGGELRVGWAGSSSHLRDLLAPARALSKLQRRHSFTFAIQGLTDAPLLEQAREVQRLTRTLRNGARERAELFLDLAGVVRPMRFEHVPFVPMERYFATLAALDLDLGLCPLEDSPFNRHRSANKFYEYAAVGTATLASDVEPYREGVRALARHDVEGWIEALEPLVADADARDRLLAAQRDWVFRERTIDAVVPAWRDALEAIVGAP